MWAIVAIPVIVVVSGIATKLQGGHIGHGMLPVFIICALITTGIALYRVGIPALRWWRRRRAARAMAVRRPPSAAVMSREPIPAGLRFAVLRRDGFRCAYCGRGEAEGVKLHIDHLVPVARGGPTSIDNLVTACQDCNLGKSASDLIGT